MYHNTIQVVHNTWVNCPTLTWILQHLVASKLAGYAQKHWGCQWSCWLEEEHAAFLDSLDARDDHRCCPLPDARDYQRSYWYAQEAPLDVVQCGQMEYCLTQATEWVNPRYYITTINAILQLIASSNYVVSTRQSKTITAILQLTASLILYLNVDSMFVVVVVG